MIELLSIGEVLWDLFPDGKQLGGATFNVAYHARQLGIEAAAVSRVGEDPLGEEILERARGLGLPADMLQRDPSLPTGTVKVALDRAGTPTFVITESVAWDAIERTAALDRAAAGVRAIVFGTLAQRSPRSRETIRATIERSGAPCKLYDINLRPPFYNEEVIRYSLEAATILKLNDDELVTVRRFFTLPDREAEACQALRMEFGIELVCVTKGERGCSVYDDSGTLDVPGRSVRVVDTVGAGDAFSAGLIVKLLEGASTEEAARFANAAGALVASKSGATPPITREEVIA